jgi:hypothetical protein
MLFFVAGLAAMAVGITRQPPVTARQAALMTLPAPLPREVYVWQRWHGEEVHDALIVHGREFSRVVVLAGQVQWQKDATTVHEVSLDWPALKQLAAAGTQIGLALRLGEFHGDFRGISGELVAGLAAKLVAGASVPVAELHLDFDCPTRRLGDYRHWVEQVRRRTNCPVIVTALPSWLGSRDFAALAGAADGFVLQVHSLDAPTKSSATLCDPGKAMAAVRRAAKVGRPFRVALPTYSCIAGFSADGRFVGVAAEGRSWPPGVQTRTIAADAGHIAGLVRDLNASPLPNLEGLIFFRLPVESDELNWSMPTLRAVMQGKTPAASLRAWLEPSELGLMDLMVANMGDADAQAPEIRTSLPQGEEWLVADGINGYVVEPVSNNERRWHCEKPLVLRPGKRLCVGWIRTTHGAILEPPRIGG